MIRLVVQAATLVLLARLLGAEQFGIFAAISAFAVILGSCTSLGLNLLFMKEISDNQKKRQDVLSYSFPSIVIAGIAMLGLYASAITYVLDVAFVPIETLLALGFAEIVIAPIILLMSAIHLTERRVWFSQLLASLQTIFRFFVLLLVILTSIEKPFYVYLCGYAVIATVTLIIASMSVVEVLPPVSSWRLPRVRELRRSAGFGSLNVVFISSSEIDKTLAVKFMPTGEVGIYAAGMRVMGALVLPIIAMLTSAMPRLFKNTQDSRRLIRWLFISAFVYGLMMAFLASLGAGILARFFGNSFDGLKQALTCMSMIIPGLAVRLTVGQILMTQKTAWSRVWYEAAGIVLLSGLFIVLGGMYGLRGAIVAMICTEWLMSIVGLYLVARLGSRLEYNELVKKS